ncbi:uncharacterized protein BKA55DRAFT_536598 [Fusarium redolens]|uniref:DUF6603 domain-containing protein n=1 Tax=Fusarium redolens TaxID=48865 RepID=A0A9P9KEW2_FUSRE|nr:uncharacterized protein BKA55DRAFT_536598 [Fusarium redolens]KAH7258883.1 hypothetical protein BKA55DRAFT_536598 [Fusarium redolens]
MPAPVLHVIYAGRGDAMILECDDYKQAGRRNFILVDGGPKNYDAYGAAREAPYHRYLSSACRQILGNGNNFAGIIFSHPDEDHYGGYLHSLQGGVFPSDNVFVPNVMSDTDNANKPIDDICVKTNMRKVAPHPQDQFPDYLIPPVKAIFPSRPGIVWYYGGTDRDEAHDLQFNRKMTTNKRSILMYTVTPNSVGEMGIFFTGDNHADIISPQIEAAFPFEHRRFAIYKIQHHGSLADNMKQFSEPLYSNEVKAIGFLYFLLKVHRGTAYLPYKKTTTDAVKHAAKHLSTKIVSRYTMNALFTSLGTVVKEIQKDMLANLNPPVEKEDRLYIGLQPSNLADARSAKDYLDKLDEELGKRRTQHLKKWNSFRKKHMTDEFLTYMHVLCVVKFYASFVADVYVVSANRRNNHPRSEVLVGLALAVKYQNRKARLYVTSGNSLDVDELARVAHVVGTDTVKELFCGQYLRISYMSRGSYMSLSGKSRGIHEDPIINREAANMTQEIRISNNNIQVDLRTKLNVLLEQTDPSRILSTRKYQIRSFVNNAWRYLYLEADNTELKWDIANNPQFIWIDTRDLTITNNRQFAIRCRTEKFGITSRRFTCSWARTVNGWDFYYIEDTISGEKLHDAPNGDIDFSTNPTQAALAEVRLELAPAQFLPETNSVQAKLSGDLVDSASLVETLPPPQFNIPIGAVAFSSQHSLRQAFEILNDSIKNKAKPNMIETLTCLYKDKDALITVLQRLPEALLKIGLATFEVDLDESTATIDSHPLEEKVIGSAVLHRAKDEEGKVNAVDIEMAGFGFQLKDIVAKVENCCSPQVHLTVESEVTLKEKGLEFKMAWNSSYKETVMSFSSSVIALEDLVIALVGTKIDPKKILQGDIPLMGKSSDSNSAQSIKSMQAGSMSRIGFSLRQPIDSVDTYNLADIWVRTESSDWQDFLPMTNNFKKVKSEVLLRVLDPLHWETSRIATSVQLSMPLPSNSKRSITAQFDAIPLARVGEYDYRFQITSADHGVTVTDIVGAVGFTSVSEKIKAMPVLDHVFEAVEVKEAGFSVVNTDNKWQFREWDFELCIPYFDLIPGSLSLIDTVIRVEWYGDGDMQAKGEAVFRSGKLQKEAKLSLGLPTTKELGYIIVSSPDAISLADVFDIFGLGTLPSIPFLNGNSAMELVYCDAKFEQSDTGKVSIRSSTAKFLRDELEVEKFKLQDVEFSLSWQNGQKADGDNKVESTISFQLSALLQIKNIKSVMSVKYDGERNELTASITPVQGFPMKALDVLSLLIPGVDSALHTRLGNLEIKIVEMSLDLSTGSPSSFKLEMKDDAAIKLPSATDTTPFSVGSVRVEYTKEASKLDVFAALMIGGIQTSVSLRTFTNSTSEERCVEFGIVLQKGQKDLGLLALLAAVGIDNVDIPRPEGCPEFTVGMARINGRFVDKDKSGLKFAQLSVRIELARISMSDWDMSVDYLYLDVDYNKASVDKPFSALVSGKLTVAGSAEMKINYIDAKDVLELQAKLLLIKVEEVKVKSILEWLSVDSIEDSLPSFISEAVIDVKSSNLGMSLSRHKGDQTSTITVSLSFTAGSVTVQLARTRTRPDGAKKKDKLPWKTILRLAVNTLPRPPPLPLIGQMEQPFSTQIYWTNSDITIAEVGKLNSLATFKGQELLLSSRAANDSAFGQGLSFLLLNNGDIILASKPRKAKKRDGTSGKAMLLLEEESPESQETTKFDKRVNGVTITNVGLDYDAKGQKIKVKFTARMTVGPMDGELINFSMIIKLPRGERIDLTDWRNLDIDMGLDGLSLAMTGSNLNVAGTLHRIKVEGDDISITGFEGGVSVKLKKYQFVGFGSYKSVKTKQEEFVSLMAYALLKGPMLKTGLVELSGISGGFGFGSKLEIPSITEIHKFPLLVDPDTDPMVMFDRLRGTGDTKYMTETNGANWVAAGVLGTACELIDVRAVLTIPLDPSAGELAIVGTASGQFPRDAKPGKALAAIKINFQGSIDMSRGSMLFQGRIADGSFILFDDCVLTGGFAVGAWFGTSPQAGDWCISIGGWHPAYQPPDHYPKGLPRMGLSWTYGKDKCLSLSGQAYAAVTPEALMGGLAVRVKYEKWSCGAEFDFRTDLILYLHPLHYNAKFHVHASLWYELDAWVLRKKFTKSLGADLTVSGPPFGGVVEFKLTVITIRVKFGEHQSKPDRLDFGDFMTVVLKNAETDHVFALESGAMTLEKVPAEAQTPKSSWIVRGGSLAFSITSRVPTTSIEFEGAQDPKRQLGGRIFARPMQLFSSSSGLTANIKASVHKINTNGEDLSEGFFFEVLREQLPASLWGSYDGNTDAMLGGTSRESTVTHATGLRIEAPLSKWSTLNPQIILFSDLWKIKPVTTQFATDQARDVAFDAEPRPNKDNEESDFAQARKALLGTDQMAEEENAAKARNTRRASIMSQWASIRKLKASASLRSNVPLRYAKGLVSFSHVAPRISVE